MRVAICGMSGFIGTNLSNYIKERGYDVLSISKSDILSGDKNILKEKISGSDVVINLAGAPISMSWSRSHIELMYKIGRASCRERVAPPV